MLWIYSMPLWLLAVATLFIILALGLWGVFRVRHIWRSPGRY